MRTTSNQIFADIDYLVDNMEMDADGCDEVLRACEDLGGISAEYFCEEFVFLPEDSTPEDVDRWHDPNYMSIAMFNSMYW